MKFREYNLKNVCIKFVPVLSESDFDILRDDVRTIDDIVYVWN